MATQRTSHVELVAVEPVRTSQALRRFEPWPDDIKERCRELWATIANRDATRTEYLLSQELPESTAIPSSVTIREWARENAWAAWADADLDASAGRTLRQLRAGWLRALELAQATLIDSMIGRLDDLPYAGSGRVKAAEVTLRTIGQSGLLAILPPPQLPETDDEEAVSPQEQARKMRERLLLEKGHER